MIHKDLLNPHYTEWLAFLAAGENWTREQIEEYQLAGAREMASYLEANSQGYRELWALHGVSAAGIRSLADLNAFPCVTKEDIRDKLERFTVAAPDMEYTSTGSSTGIPFGFYRTPQAFGRELASKAYQYYRVGWKEGDRQLVFRGTPIDTPDKTLFYPEFNELRCSTYYMTQEWLELFRQKALEYQPEWLRCYPSSAFLLARFIKETGRPMPQLKGILLTSENLYDFQKEYISKTFNCRIFCHYGHFELAALAGFCEKADSYHVLPQYGYVQLLDREDKPVTRPGQVGEIVATSFLMKATGFFRYRTRDFAVYQGESCPECGRPYQIWSRIEGRLQEYFVTKDRRCVSMSAVNMHDDIFNELLQFQYYQEQPGTVILRYIPKSSFSPASERKIREKLLFKFDNSVDIILQEVGEEGITRTRRGKCLYLVQKIKLDSADVYRNRVQG